jgi:hypothetical protein
MINLCSAALSEIGSTIVKSQSVNAGNDKQRCHINNCPLEGL